MSWVIIFSGMGTQLNKGGYNVVLFSVHARNCTYGNGLRYISNRVGLVSRVGVGVRVGLLIIGFGPQPSQTKNAGSTSIFFKLNPNNCSAFTLLFYLLSQCQNYQRNQYRWISSKNNSEQLLFNCCNGCIYMHNEYRRLVVPI